MLPALPARPPTEDSASQTHKHTPVQLVSAVFLSKKKHTLKLSLDPPASRACSSGGKLRSSARLGMLAPRRFSTSFSSCGSSYLHVQHVTHNRALVTSVTCCNQWSLAGALAWCRPHPGGGCQWDRRHCAQDLDCANNAQKERDILDLQRKGDMSHLGSQASATVWAQPNTCLSCNCVPTCKRYFYYSDHLQPSNCGCHIASASSTPANQTFL